MKGPDDTRIREAVAYLHGRLELEIEYYASHKGLDPLALTPLVGSALVGPAMDNLPAVQQAPRKAHPPAPEMEMVDRAHGGRTPAPTRGRPRKNASGEVAGETKKERRKRLDRERQQRNRDAAAEAAAKKNVTHSQASKGYWAKMTPEQRSKEMKRRAKVALAKGHKAFPSLMLGNKKKKRKLDAAKQRLFVERYKLRKQGVPEDQLPPLPSKAPAA